MALVERRAAHQAGRHRQGQRPLDGGPGPGHDLPLGREAHQGVRLVEGDPAHLVELVVVVARSPPSAPSGSSARSCGCGHRPGRSSTRCHRRARGCGPPGRSPRRPRAGPSARWSRPARACPWAGTTAPGHGRAGAGRAPARDGPGRRGRRSPQLRWPARCAGGAATSRSAAPRRGAIRPRATRERHRPGRPADRSTPAERGDGPSRGFCHDHPMAAVQAIDERRSGCQRLGMRRLEEARQVAPLQPQLALAVASGGPDETGADPCAADGGDAAVHLPHGNAPTPRCNTPPVLRCHASGRQRGAPAALSPRPVNLKSWQGRRKAPRTRPAGPFSRWGVRQGFKPWRSGPWAVLGNL